MYITTKKRKSLLDLKGKIEFAPGYDYKKLRSAVETPRWGVSHDDQASVTCQSKTSRRVGST